MTTSEKVTPARRTSFFPVSWDQFHRDLPGADLAAQRGSDRFHAVIAITRGGLVPAAIVAREPSVCA